MGDENDATVHDLTAPDEAEIDRPSRTLSEGAADPDAADPDAADPAATAAQIAPLGDEVMGLLAQHVPLALLADLAAPSDRDSTEILRSEGLPADAWWEAPSDPGSPPDPRVANRSPDTEDKGSRTE